MPFQFEMNAIDWLLIGPAWLLWLTVGTAVLDGTDRLVRYAVGGVGVLLVTIGLFLNHGLGRFLWMPFGVLGVGLGWLLLMRAFLEGRDIWRKRRADQAARRATGHVKD